MRRFKNIHLIALALYFLISVLFTYPLIFHLRHGVVGDVKYDSAQFPSNVFLFTNAISHGHNPFLTQYVCYPNEVNLFMHTYVPSVSIFGFIFNPFLTVNMFIFFHFVMSAYGAFLLARFFDIRIIWSFIVGFVFAFNPYKTLHLPFHFNLVCTAIIPFYILFFLRFNLGLNQAREMNTSRAKMYLFSCCLLLILSFFTDYYYTFYLLLFSVLYYAFKYFVYPFSQVKYFVLYIMLALLLNHLILDFLIHVPAIRGGETFYWSSDFIRLFVPSFNSFFYALFHLNEGVFGFKNATNSLEFEIFMGYSLLIAFAFASVLFFKNSKSDWLSKCLFFLIICFVMFMIPRCAVAGKSVFNFPSSWLNFIPFVNNFRVSSRFVLMLYLFIPLFTVIQLANAYNTRLFNNILSLIFLVIIGVEYYPKPILVSDFTHYDSVFEQLSILPEGVVCPLPTGISSGSKGIGKFENENLIYQTIHRKPLIGGYISRVPDEVYQLYTQDKLMNQLISLSNKNILPNGKITSEMVQQFFNTFHVKYFLIRRNNESKLYEMLLEQVFEYKKCKQKIETEQYNLYVM